jgi:hypothetical protein
LAGVGSHVRATGGVVDHRHGHSSNVVETLIRVVETGATEATLGVAVELVLSQTCRAVGFERRTRLTAASGYTIRSSSRRHHRRPHAEAWRCSTGSCRS